ncbi:MAG: hypothetical protein IT293_18010 [Deltaproteobacteria bacterium]|nr:hypothetical protein [Deltaproteobacteria bacterium]
MRALLTAEIERTTARGASQGLGRWHALPTPVAFSPRGRIAFVSAPDTVRIVSIIGGDVLAEVAVPRNVCALAFANESLLVGIAAPHMSDPPMLVHMRADGFVATQALALPPVAAVTVSSARTFGDAVLFTGEARVRFGLRAPVDPALPAWVETDSTDQPSTFITALDGSAMLRIVTRGGVNSTIVTAEPTGAASLTIAELPLAVDAAQWVDGRHVVVAGAADNRFAPPRVLAGIDPVNGAERWRLGGAAANDANARLAVEWFAAGSSRMPVRADRGAVALLHRASISAPAQVSAITIEGEILWTTDAPATAAFDWLAGGELVFTDVGGDELHIVRGEVGAVERLVPLPPAREELDAIVARLEVSPDHRIVVLSRVEAWTEHLCMIDSELLSGVLT